MSHLSKTIGELGYLVEYDKSKEGNTANHVFWSSSFGILYLG
jgi:hypothetical protein